MIVGQDVSPEALRDKLAARGFSFLDFGCSKGDSFRFAQGVLGLGEGLGLDIDPAKVEATLARGYPAIVQDVTALEELKSVVEVVLMSHFLEHLPSPKTAGVAARNALKAARRYVLIRQPFFDANGPLMMLGMKMFFADWSGHPNLMTSYDIWRAFRRPLERGAIGLAILGRGRVASSSHRSVVPLSAPTNLNADGLHAYAGALPEVTFDFPVYEETVAIAVRRRNDGWAADWREIAARIKGCEVISTFGFDEEPL